MRRKSGEKFGFSCSVTHQCDQVVGIKVERWTGVQLTVVLIID